MELLEEKYMKVIDESPTYKRYGKVTQVIGLTIEVTGLDANIGEICLIYPQQNVRPIEAEVVGFREQRILLMPFGDLAEVGSGSLVAGSGRALDIKVGDSLLGKVLDGLGIPIDEHTHIIASERILTTGKPPNPLSRPRIEEPLEVGIRAIDGLITIGKGQRVGIFSGSGVGKSTMMGMIARNTAADVNVIALIGERGREVKEFIERDLGPEGLKKSVIVVATSDQPALQRIKGAFTATSIAEYFRDKGLNVMLMMDSVTRFAMAQREVGLAIGEPPTSKGYTPSVFALLPKLLERAGTSEKGSITAFYSVLVDGDDFNEPIADSVRGIIDGHIVLDRKIAENGLFPAINISSSISRVMQDIVPIEQLQAATEVKRLYSAYTSAEDLIKIGAYKKGADKLTDRAVKMMPIIEDYIKQSTNEESSLEDAVAQLMAHFGGGDTHVQI